MGAFVALPGVGALLSVSPIRGIFSVGCGAAKNNRENIGRNGPYNEHTVCTNLEWEGFPWLAEKDSLAVTWMASLFLWAPFVFLPFHLLNFFRLSLLSE